MECQYCLCSVCYSGNPTIRADELSDVERRRVLGARVWRCTNSRVYYTIESQPIVRNVSARVSYGDRCTCWMRCW